MWAGGGVVVFLNSLPFHGRLVLILNSLLFRERLVILLNSLPLFFPVSMVDFLEALKRPFASLNSLVIGVFIGALPFVNILLLGFGLGEAERVLFHRKKPVKWWHIGSIITDSIAAFAVTVFYFSPVIMGAIFFLGPLAAEIVWVIEKSMIVHYALGGSNPFLLAGLSLAVLGEIARLTAENALLIAPFFLLGLAFYYILPFALVNFARRREIMAAFDFKAVRKAFSAGYLFYWLLFHLYLFALFAVLSVLFFLPVLNFLLGGFILFIYATTGFNLFTQLFLEAG